MGDDLKRNFFGAYIHDHTNFRFDPEERKLLLSIPELLNAAECLNIDESQLDDLSKQWKSNSNWFFTENNGNTFDKGPTQNIDDTIVAPLASMNLMSELNKMGKRNACRSKYGYRYSDKIKRLAVYQRILSGRKAYGTLHANAFGLIPSRKAIDKYIYRPENIIVEGELRCTALLAYLNERQLPLWVVLSEDATVIDNRPQYDSRTNQIIGLVPPINNKTGMPQPFAYKAENGEDFFQHFASAPVSNYINTVMAKPIGDAPAFCLLLFGSDNKYTSKDVSYRWNFITKQLNEIGIGVLAISSDSDPKFNCAMRANSCLGQSSNVFSNSKLFMCGNKMEPPFFVQDTPHIGTKARNLLLKTKANTKRLPFGEKYFITMAHLQSLVERFNKSEHLLTRSTLNPKDRQNYDSVLKICDKRVTNMLKKHVDDSEATVIFLDSIILNSIESFMSDKISPLERVEKMWKAVFMARIWKYFVLKHPKYTLKNHFMSSNLYSCLEQNAHSLVLIILFLKENNLNHLFIPWFYNSQACEKFFAQMRALCSTYSMIATCSVKEAVSRVSKIHLLSEISNDKESGFVFPTSDRIKSYSAQNSFVLPSKDEIFQSILKCKNEAIESGIELGLITKKSKDKSCECQIQPYTSFKRKTKIVHTEIKFPILPPLHACGALHLKNYANKFGDQPVDKTSTYVEIPDCDERFIVKKTSLCWLLRRETIKSSSDRLLRVMSGPQRRKGKKKNYNIKKKPFAKYTSTQSISLKKRKTLKRKL